MVDLKLKERDKNRIFKLCQKDKMELVENNQYQSIWKRYKIKQAAEKEAEFMLNKHPFMEPETAQIKKSKCGGWNVYIGQQK